MTHTQLRIPAPCAESWAAMTPAGPGRHCAACAKVVVDFTQKTDAEILAYLAGAGSQSCGRFRAAQLGRPLQQPPSASRWRTWLGALLAAGSMGALLAPKATAQAVLRGTAGPVPLATTSQEPVPVAGGKPGSTTGLADTQLITNQSTSNQVVSNNLTEIQGIVQDARCTPLPGATVRLKGTTIGTATDRNGQFKLPLPPMGQPPQLVISFIGFATQERTVTSTTAARMEIALEEEVMGLLIIPYRPPMPWHPRAFYHWSKYWLTRPFRR